METLIIPKDFPFEEKRPKGRATRWSKPHPEEEHLAHPEINREDVRSFRESMGWYQRHLAVRTGYSEKSIKHIELGIQPITGFFTAVMGLLRENKELEEENARLRDELTDIRGYERDRDALNP